MISVRYDKETDEFQVKGTVSLGMLGTFENKDYDEDNISISMSLDFLLGEVEDNEYSELMGNLYYRLKDAPEDGDAVAAILQDYYNEKLQELDKNVKQFNDMIWTQMFEWFMCVGFEFWEDERMIAPQYRGHDWSEEVEAILYTEKQHEICERLREFKCDSSNNGTIEKPDIEKIMREYFYMFNFDGLVENIENAYFIFDYDWIKFQFDDKWGQRIFSSTYAVLNGDFSIIDWVNF